MIQVRSLHADAQGTIYCLVQEDRKACFYLEKHIDEILYPYISSTDSSDLSSEKIEKITEDYLNKKGVTIKNIPALKRFYTPGSRFYSPVVHIYAKMILSERPEAGFILNQNTLKEACAETGWSKIDFLQKLEKDVEKYHLENDIKIDRNRIYLETKMSPDSECYNELKQVYAIKDMNGHPYYALCYPSLLLRFAIDVEPEGFFSRLLNSFSVQNFFPVLQAQKYTWF